MSPRSNSFLLIQLTGLLCISIVLSACPKPLLEDLDQLEKSLTGSFSSQNQSISDSSYFDIRLEVASIWPDRSDGPWLYVEQAEVDSRDRPYRQRVYHLSKSDSFLISKIYTITNPLRFAGESAASNHLSSLAPDSLMLREGCAVYLTRTGKEDFLGKTNDRTCPSSLRGSSFATSEVEIDKNTLLSWDRGFDSDGNQVWGATKGPYIFERVHKE